jgi:biopolymer transport protein ExbD
MFQKKLDEDGAFRDVNLTPLIDVALVLVVILLLATPLAFESSILVRNTSTRGNQAEKKTKDEHVELRVLDDDVVRVNRTPVARNELTATLRPLLDDTGSRRVIVACNDGVSHGAFVNVLDQAKVSGAAEIAVMGK